jgi:hypothetical protein
MEEEMDREREDGVLVYGDGHKYKFRNNKSGAYVYSGKGHNHGVIVITKDTSDDELRELQRKMEAEGISFNYSKVKRNAAGEISRIKITTKNDNGSKSVISAQADDGEPIDEIIIQN